MRPEPELNAPRLRLAVEAAARPEIAWHRVKQIVGRVRVAWLGQLLSAVTGPGEIPVAEARKQLAAVEGGADPLAAAAETVTAAERRVEQLSGALHEARAAAAPPFAVAVAEELKGIGLGEGEFHVELHPAAAGVTGADEARFLIRPNMGLPFAPVAETASGGELSRIALAIAAVGGGETLVFDEIDAGIGGRTAHAVGETLRRLATRAQVVTITHLPQIASVADRHFRVEKVPGDPTHTRIEPLDDDERREEIRRMLGGQEFISAVQQER